MNVKLGTEEIRSVSVFVKVTGIQPKDCLITDATLFFVLDPKAMFLAIGKNGENIKRLRKTFGKNVKLFAKYGTAEETIKGMIPNIKALKISEDVAVASIPIEDKSKVIGRNGGNIKAMKEVLMRHFAVKDLKIRV
ncbi:MAG: NusA-like transcription termination signal-binding factor [Candidatus Aenigmatarchaeota archaeon]